MFKRTVSTSATGPPKGGFFLGICMDFYIFTDESGVFDRNHNDYFVYGGILFPDFESKEIFSRMYIHAERAFRKSGKYKSISELKASNISNTDKGKLFRSTNQCYRFGVVIDEQKLMTIDFHNKKSKQRYLDYAFKIGLKRYFEFLIRSGEFSADEVNNVYLFCDQHSTASNGCYDLQKSIFNEFRMGAFNYVYHPSITPNLKNVVVKYCDSSSTTLIRSADIIANRIYYCARFDSAKLTANKNLYVTFLP